MFRDLCILVLGTLLFGCATAKKSSDSDLQAMKGSKKGDIQTFSIWLVANEDTHEFKELNNVISSMATKYKSNAFTPHTTLLASVRMSEEEAIKRTDQLAGEIKSFDLMLMNLGRTRQFYRSLFAYVKGGDALSKAHQLGLKIFGVNTDPGFMPHLSLAYGEFTDDQKDQMVDDIVKLLQRKRRSDPLGIKYKVNDVRLYFTGSGEKNFRLVHKASFQAQTKER